MKQVLCLLPDTSLNKLTNHVVFSETDDAFQPDPSNVLMIEEENSSSEEHKEPLPGNDPGYRAQRAVLLSDVKNSKITAGALDTTCAQDSTEGPALDINGFLSKCNSSEEKDTKYSLNRDSCTDADSSVMEEESSSDSRSDILKNALPGRVLNYTANTQEPLGFSVLDSMNTSKILTVNQTRLSNYSRNFSSLNDDTLSGAESKNDPVPRSMYAAAEDSSSDTESVVETPSLAGRSVLSPSAHENPLESQNAMESDEEQIEICCLNSEERKQQVTSAAEMFPCLPEHSHSDKALQIEIGSEKFSLERSHSVRNCNAERSATTFSSPSQVSSPGSERSDHTVDDNTVFSFHKNGVLQGERRLSMGSRENPTEMSGTSKHDSEATCLRKNVNSWGSHLLDKDEQKKPHRSDAENGIQAVGCHSALTKKGTRDSGVLSKPDSNPVERTGISSKSPLLMKSKGDLNKCIPAHDLMGKSEKANGIPASKGSNAKILSSGSDQCKGVRVLHSPSSPKKLHPEIRGTPQKSIAESLSDNQRNKPEPKLKGLSVKSKAKTNSDALSAAHAKVGLDQKTVSVPAQSSPRLFAKRGAVQRNPAGHLEPPGRSLFTGSKVLPQDEEHKLSSVVPHGSLLPLLNGDSNTVKSNENKYINHLELSEITMAQDSIPVEEASGGPQVTLNNEERVKADEGDNQPREAPSQVQAPSKITPKGSRSGKDGKGMNLLNHGCEMNSLGLYNDGSSQNVFPSLLYSPIQAEQSAQEMQRSFIEVRLSSSSFAPPSLVPQVPLQKEEGNPSKSSHLGPFDHERQNVFEEEKVRVASKPVTRTYSVPAQLSNHLREESNASDVPTHHVQDMLSHVSGDKCSRSEMGMLKIVHLSLLNGQNTQDVKETSNGVPKSTTQELPLANDNSSRIADKLRTCRRNYYYYELNWPHDPISSFSVKQRIKSFENLANFDRPFVKAIDIHSTALHSKLPIGRRLSGGASAVSVTSVNDAVQALRRSFSSYCESEAPASPRVTRSSTSCTLAHLQQNYTENSKDDAQFENSKRGDALGGSHSLLPSSASGQRSRTSGGHIRHTPLSRSKLRELRALSMPDLDKLCSEDFSVEPKSSHFQTDLEITPAARSLGLPTESVSTLHECAELSNLETANRQRSKEGSPWHSGSGTPGSASDEEALQHDGPLVDTMHVGKSWSIR